MTTVENSNQKVQGGPPVVPLNPLFQSPKSPRDGNGKFITGSTSMIHPMDDSVSFIISWTGLAVSGSQIPDNMNISVFPSGANVSISTRPIFSRRW